jgi:hypothetical protein
VAGGGEYVAFSIVASFLCIVFSSSFAAAVVALDVSEKC